MLITSEELVADIREMSGLKKSRFLSDTQIVSMASDALQELYDILVNAREHYFKKHCDKPVAC